MIVLAGWSLSWCKKRGKIIVLSELTSHTIIFKRHGNFISAISRAGGAKYYEVLIICFPLPRRPSTRMTLWARLSSLTCKINWLTIIGKKTDDVNTYLLDHVKYDFYKKVRDFTKVTTNYLDVRLNVARHLWSVITDFTKCL